MIFEETICAPATSVGTGAVSMIRVSGPEALAVASRVVRLRSGSVAEAKGYSLHFGEAVSSAGRFIDDVMVGVFRAPHSYTGEDSVEISCHASEYIVRSIVASLCDAGVRTALPGEFTRRAYLNGKMDLAQAEAVADIIAAESEAQHSLACSQLNGAFSAELRDLRNRLVELSALMELELDFSEEDVEFADRGRLSELLDNAIGHIGELVASFRDGNAIRYGVPVAIVGAPNSGKSTLLNALLGDERAIVSDIPGTTRDTVEEVITLGGVKFRFIDTAGLRQTSDVIEKIGVERSLEAVRKARVVIEVVDGLEPMRSRDNGSADVRTMLDDGQKLIVVWNKADLMPCRCLVDDALLISAKTGEGLDELRGRIAASYKVGVNHTMVSNARHYEALKRALAALEDVRAGLRRSDSGSVTPLPTELLCEHLRTAISELNSIFGEKIGTEEVLGEIFGRFCIGK